MPSDIFASGLKFGGCGVHVGIVVAEVWWYDVASGEGPEQGDAEPMVEGNVIRVIGHGHKEWQPRNQDRERLGWAATGNFSEVASCTQSASHSCIKLPGHAGGLLYFV